MIEVCFMRCLLSILISDFVAAVVHSTLRRTDNIEPVLDDSLKQLSTDCIDLCSVHWYIVTLPHQYRISLLIII